MTRRAPYPMTATRSTSTSGATHTANLTTLLRVCLELMSRPECATAYQPVSLDLWRPPAALARMRRMLGEIETSDPPNAVSLAQFLPPRQATPTLLQRRVALPSTLFAGLELARDTIAHLEQEQTFEDIRVRRIASALARVA